MTAIRHEIVALALTLLLADVYPDFSHGSKLVILILLESILLGITIPIRLVAVLPLLSPLGMHRWVSRLVHLAVYMRGPT